MQAIPEEPKRATEHSGREEWKGGARAVDAGSRWLRRPRCTVRRRLLNLARRRRCFSPLLIESSRHVIAGNRAGSLRFSRDTREKCWRRHRGLISPRRAAKRNYGDPCTRRKPTLRKALSIDVHLSIHYLEDISWGILLGFCEISNDISRLGNLQVDAILDFEARMGCWEKMEAWRFMIFLG